MKRRSEPPPPVERLENLEQGASDPHESMDRFSAHLDRGWDLVQQGDSRGAEASARRALQINGEAPEAYNLLGYAAALRGEFEEAIAHYSQALTLDDTYFEAMLNAAEVFIHPLGDFAEAVELCDRALDLAESDDERVDALLLKFDALMGGERTDEAKALCRRFPAGPFDNPAHSFLVGRALYEVGEVEKSAPLIESAAKESPDNGEAHYYLGLLRDEQGDRSEATHAFALARALELQTPPPEWSLSVAAFQQLVQRVVEQLSPEHRAAVRPGEVYTSDMPGLELVIDGVDPRALLLVDDIAPTHAGHPTARLFVYQRNVERAAGALESLEEELLEALTREIALMFEEEGFAPAAGSSDPRLLN